MRLEIENRMIVDEAWDEEEYHVPSKRRLKREHEAYEALEREDEEDD